MTKEQQGGRQGPVARGSQKGKQLARRPVGKNPCMATRPYIAGLSRTGPIRPDATGPIRDSGVRRTARKCREGGP